MKKKKKSGTKILIILLILVIIVAGGILAYKIYTGKDDSDVLSIADNIFTPPAEKKEVQIFKGNDRPIAVMIDNHIDAMPQAGLNSAYLVYEFIVEGGETRLMELFKGVNLDKIGPIRSSRHYYLDYALENDAIYVHFGWSPQAKDDITKLGVNNINGIFESATSFKRSTDKQHSYLHSVTTTTDTIKQIAERKGYRTTSEQKSVLNYVGEEVNLDSDIEATKITIPYSTSNTVTYEYDEVTKRYTRYSRNVKQIDWATGETVTVKNIIVYNCYNWTLNDGENKGRQSLDNVKTLEGYYITNGKAIKITAEKTARNTQTVYKDLNGNEIEVNDGNTFIQICPRDSKVVIEPGEPKVEETVTNETITGNEIN